MDLNDKECVERCRDGHPEDFGHLVDRYQKPLYSWLAGRVRDDWRAEEAAQETFVRAFTSLRKLRKPIDPSEWKLDLPADVSWVQLEPPKLPDNTKYASMTAEQAARAFFDACSREDWDEAGKFDSPVNQSLKDYLGGLQIISLGQSFTSTTYVGRFVPYEIRLKNGSVRKWNLALRKDNPAGRWQVDGGI